MSESRRKVRNPGIILEFYGVRGFSFDLFFSWLWSRAFLGFPGNRVGIRNPRRYLRRNHAESPESRNHLAEILVFPDIFVPSWWNLVSPLTAQPARPSQPSQRSRARRAAAQAAQPSPARPASDVRSPKRGARLGRASFQRLLTV